MEEGFADLLRDAFAEEKHEEETSAISCENIPAEEKQMHQEAPSFCCTGIINAEEEASDEAGFQGEVVVSTGKSQEECYTSSGEDSAQEGEEGGEEMKLVKQLMWDLNGEGDRHGSKGDRPSVERQPLAPEGGENTRVRNKEQGENESDEMSYFQRVPEHGSKTERTEDNQQEPDPESKALNSEEEEEEDYDDERNDDEEEEELLTLCFEQEDKPPHWDNPGGDILDFSELIVEHLQDLIAEVDDGESVEKMKEFSGEEHQDAGESFAEYPSDFSSCEYIEAGEKDEESNGQCTGDRAKRVSDSEALFVGSRETEQGESELVETMSGDTAEKRYETSDSSTSSDDETQTTSDEEPDLTSKDFESKIRLEERHSGSRMSADPGTSLFSDDLLVADKEEFPGVTPAEGVRMFPGSVFTTEHQDSQISELGDLGGDEYEEKTNWEQEQERIKAFYDFYTDSDQVTREAGRPTKVQFSTELFSQVILYETDSSDRGSLSSSTDGEEELSSAETAEESKEPEERTELEPTCSVPNTQTESVSNLSQKQKKRRQCLNMLKAALKMGAIVMTGLLMFWWATDQAGWLSHGSFL